VTQPWYRKALATRFENASSNGLADPMAFGFTVATVCRGIGAQPMPDPFCRMPFDAAFAVDQQQSVA
jgi:hypothetical protein